MQTHKFFGRPFVTRFTLCYWTVVLSVLSVCLSVLSATLVYCGQTVGWLKMKLGMEVSLGHGHIVLDGNPALYSPETARSSLSIFGPCLLWPNNWMDQDSTWYGGKPWPRPHCDRWDCSSPPEKRAQLPILGRHLLWPNSWMDQDEIWHGGRHRPKRHCVRWGPSSP